MNSRIFLLIAWMTSLAMLGQTRIQAQAVAVTMQLETNIVAPGQVTTLRVFAQVVPTLQANSDRIFSWYVDVLNTNNAAATAAYNAMVKSASDNDPQLSSTGTTQGANRVGIYDTFINRPGAGVNDPVLLMSIPVVGVAGGNTRFSVRAGTGSPALVNDFLVAPKTGGDPFTGGDYALASANLTVIGAPCSIQVTFQRLDAQVPAGRLQVQFTPCPGRTHTVESRTLVDSGTWQPLPGAPHNSGTVFVTNTVPQRYFRVRVD